MRTKLLIAAAGLAGLMALPGAAQAQYWRGYGYVRPYPPPPPFYRPPFYGPPFYRPHVFYRPPPVFVPPPFYRPRVFYPPPLVYVPPPRVAYAPPAYVAPRVRHRRRVVRRVAHRAAVPCPCATPAAAAPSLPALRPSAPTPAAPAPANNLYPPERSQTP